MSDFKHIIKRIENPNEEVLNEWAGKGYVLKAMLVEYKKNHIAEYIPYTAAYMQYDNSIDVVGDVKETLDSSDAIKEAIRSHHIALENIGKPNVEQAIRTGIRDVFGSMIDGDDIAKAIRDGFEKVAKGITRDL